MAYRYYGGLGVYDGAISSLDHGRDSESGYFQGISAHRGHGTTVPVQATLGYQWRPRLAVQLGAAYSGFAFQQLSAEYSPITQLSYVSFYTTRHRYVLLALLGRYTLTREPARRVQVDALLGLTLDAHAQGRQGFRTDLGRNGQADTTFFRGNYATDAVGLLSLGADVRYRLGPRFEAAYDCQLAGWPPIAQYFHLTTSLGLRYRFGRPEAIY